MAVTTSAIRAESLFYSDRETKFLGDRELIIKSSFDTISKMVLILDEFLAISAATKYFSWRGGGGNLRFLFILNLPHQGGNGGTSLPSNFLFSFFLPSPLFVHLSQPSLRHSLLFTPSKRRRCFFFHFVAPGKFLGRFASRFLLFINGTNRRIFCALEIWGKYTIDKYPMWY